jgi:hypothetical protein
MGDPYWKQFLKEFTGRDELTPSVVRDVLFMIGVEGLLSEFENWLLTHNKLKD